MRTLKLSGRKGTELQNFGAMLLARFLPAATALRFLDVRHNCIGNSGKEAIALALAQAGERSHRRNSQAWMELDDADADADANGKVAIALGLDPCLSSTELPVSAPIPYRQVRAPANDDLSSPNHGLQFFCCDEWAIW